MSINKTEVTDENDTSIMTWDPADNNNIQLDVAYQIHQSPSTYEPDLECIKIVSSNLNTMYYHEVITQNDTNNFLYDLRLKEDYNKVSIPESSTRLLHSCVDSNPPK
jgi:hypothetical protein